VKKLLIATTAFVSLATGALAADPPRAFVPVVAPAFTWTGVYVGVHAGVWFGDDENGDRGGPSTLTFPVGAGGPGSPFTFTSAGAAAFGAGTGTPFINAGIPIPIGTVLPLNSVCTNCGGDRDNSFVFGAQVGYNYQFTPGAGFVFGIEADASTSLGQGDRNRRAVVNGTTFTTPAFVGTPPLGLFGTAPSQLGPNTFTVFDPRVAQSEEPDWFGTLRVRLGYAFDRWLVYGTGGLAFSVGGRVDPTVTVLTHLGPLPTQNGFCRTNNNCDDTRWGWTLGAGVEYALTNNWSVKAEGLYVNLDDDGRQATGPLAYGVFSGPGVGPGTSVTFYAPATAFSPRGNGGDDNFFVLRAGVNYRFGS
jgi:outer membrane immunogenic protein